MHFSEFSSGRDVAMWREPQASELAVCQLFSDELERACSGTLLVDLYAQLAVLLWRWMWRQYARRA